MAGIYIHIPFCKQACHYCNFHFSTSLKYKDPLLDCIIKEIEMQKDFLPTRELTSIYFGGGTPSLLSADEISRIMDQLAQYYHWTTGIEVTLEANPDDITASKIKDFRTAGINRLSIGIQSFLEEELLFANRAHNVQESLNAVAISQDAGINNLSIDLIYGMPLSTSDSWAYNVETAVQLDVDHISSYALTVEPMTALDYMVRKNKVSLPSETIVSEQYLYLIAQLTKAEYDHYEISNFAKPAKYAIHNTSYWQSVPYLGIGPGAHSYMPCHRQWNISNNAKYTKAIQSNTIPAVTEKTTYAEGFNEYAMTRLRTMWGIDISDLIKRYPLEVDRVNRDLDQYNKSKHLIIQDNHYRLTPQGRLLADKIASDLFLVN